MNDRKMTTLSVLSTLKNCLRHRDSTESEILARWNNLLALKGSKTSKLSVVGAPEHSNGLKNLGTGK